MIARNPMIALTVPMSHNPLRPDWEMSSSRPTEHALKIFHYRRNPNIAHFASLAENDFHSIFGNLLSHSNSKRDTDQIRVLELHPRPLIAVVEHHIESRNLQGIRD